MEEYNILGIFRGMKKLLLGLLFSNSVLAQAAKPVAVALEAHLKNFVHAETQEQPNKIAAAEQLSDLKKREIVLNLFFNNQYSQLNQASCSTIISENLVSDLNLFTVCDEQSANLFSKLNYTKTIFGEIHLIHDLLTPTTDRVQLLKSQALVKTLVDHPATTAKIEQSLRTVSLNQAAFLKLWLNDKDSVANLYYKVGFLKPINKSAMALATINTVFQTYDWVTCHILEAPRVMEKNVREGITGFGPVALSFVKYNLDPRNIWGPSVEWIGARMPAGQSAIAADIRAKFLETYKVNIQNSTFNNEVRIREEDSNSKALMSIMATFSKYIFYSQYFARRKVINELQAQLVAVSAAIRSWEEIREIFQHDLGIELEPVVLSGEAQELISDLHRATFDSASNLYFEGRVLKCYNQIKAVKEQLAKIFVQVGYVDSYLSAAQLYNSGTTHKTKFCFVDYLDAQAPNVMGEGYWNIMIDPKTVVINNLVADKNIILTGANAGGKSTTIKAFVQNILLAQTFGIAAATKFALTPFTKLITYLNITDDLSNGKSLFKAEVERAQTLVNTINGLAANQFGFCAIDELFTGTAADAGEACALDLINKLSHKLNTNFVFATHYQDLTKLAAKSKRFANYCMLPPTKVNGKLVYPFVIGQGINITNVAKDILAEANLDLI